MFPGIIEGRNFCYTAPAGMDNCNDLHCRVEEDQGVRTISSAWFPTPAELELLNQGAPVILTVWGNAHPVVMLQAKGLSLVG